MEAACTEKRKRLSLAQVRDPSVNSAVDIIKEFEVMRDVGAPWYDQTETLSDAILE